MQKNCIILASGNGSNALNLIKRFYINKTGSSLINISALVSNIENAPVIDKVKKTAPDIPVLILPYASFSERDRFESRLEALIKKYKADYIILAGFMKILSEKFVSKFPNRIINIHPSLLPAFKGREAIKNAFEYGVKYTGVTVHYVTHEVDAGPIICQEIVKIDDSDTLESLEAKVHKAEHKIYPVALETVLSCNAQC